MLLKMEKYLQLKSDVAEFEKNLGLAISTNKLSFILSNGEIINRWNEKDREILYNEYKKEFLAKYIPAQIREKYTIYLRFDFNSCRYEEDKYVFQLDISIRHRWTVKKRLTWRNTIIDFFKGGGTKATFDDVSIAKDFEFLKSKSKEMVSEILPEFAFLNAIHSDLPWKILMSKYLYKYLKNNKIESVEFPVAVGRRQDTMKYTSFVINNSKTFFEHATKHMINGKTEGLWITSPYVMVTILSQLMENDVVKVGDKITVTKDIINNGQLMFPEVEITIDNIKNKVIDYTYQPYQQSEETIVVKDKHISDIVTQLNPMFKS